MELVQQIGVAIQRRHLEKQETLALRGRLGFADNFLRGRLGKLVLKQLVDHAYGSTKRLDPGLIASLRAMSERLTSAKPRVVSFHHCKQWYIFSL